MLRRGTYFQATTAILRLPRGPTKWEGWREEWSEVMGERGTLGNVFLPPDVCQASTLEMLGWKTRTTKEYVVPGFSWKPQRRGLVHRWFSDTNTQMLHDQNSNALDVHNSLFFYSLKEKGNWSWLSIWLTVRVTMILLCIVSIRNWIFLLDKINHKSHSLQ